MKRDIRQFKARIDKQWRPQYFILLYVAIFLQLLIITADGEAAASSVDYPSRPIVYVNHSSPGGNNDVFCRVVSDVIQKEKILNQPLVAFSKPGSAGAAAMGYLFEKKGNPYAILNIMSVVFICTTLLEKLPYDMKSFTPIANLSTEGSVLVVRRDSPFKNAGSIIDEARKRPKELLQGGAAFTATQNINALSIQKLKGVQWSFVSFKNNAEALLNVLSGNVDFVFAPPEDALEYVRAGKLRALLIVDSNRYPEFKDVPTVKEMGLGEPIMLHFGIVGPPSMPEYAVKKLEGAFKKVSNSDRFKKFLSDQMMQPVWMSAVEYGKLLDKESDRLRERLSEIGILKAK